MLQDIENEKASETVLAVSLLESLLHCRIRWRESHKGSQVDAHVCAFLGKVDQDFNAEKELKILKDQEGIIQSRNEYICFRVREATASDPAISTTQALRDAASGDMKPILLDFFMGLSSTGTTRDTDNTRGTTYASPTHDHTVVDIADTLGNISISAGKNHPTDKDAIVYIADRLGNVTTATRPPAVVGNAGASSSISNGAAGPSTSPAKGSSTNDQTLPRDDRKRAEARAKEASANTGKSPGNHDDDDGEGPGLVGA